MTGTVTDSARSSVGAILFDLDGTLVDTAPDLVAVLNRILAESGHPPAPYATARNEVSRGAAGLLRFAYGADLSPGRFNALHQRFLDLYMEQVCVRSRFFITLEQIETSITAANRQWGIVTNKPSAMTQTLLDRLGAARAPGTLVCGDQLPQRKPHPAPLLLAAEELALDPGRCIYVGDAARDIEAGRAAGMATIAAAYGYIRAREDISVWAADHVVRSPAALIELITRL